MRTERTREHPGPRPTQTSKEMRLLLLRLGVPVPSRIQVQRLYSSRRQKDGYQWSWLAFDFDSPHSDWRAGSTTPAREVLKAYKNPERTVSWVRTTGGYSLLVK